MKRHYIIYTYVDPRNNNIFYVGQSINGLSRAFNFKQHNTWCRRVISKIKAANLEVKVNIVEELEKTQNIRNDLNTAEKIWCARLQNDGHHLTNLLFGDDMNQPHLYETEKKVHGNKGKKRTPEQKEAQRLQRLGCKATAETKQKMSKASRGKKKSESHKQNLRDNWHTTRPPEIWDNMSRLRKGVPRSPEVRAKLSEANKKSAAAGWETRRKNATLKDTFIHQE